MDNVKDDKYYFKKAVEEIEIIERYVADKTYSEFMADEKLIDAVMFRLVQLIENVKKISQSFKNSHPSIEWGNIVGFRNGIVHHYGKTDYSIVYEVASHDLSELKEVFIQNM